MTFLYTIYIFNVLLSIYVQYKLVFNEKTLKKQKIAQSFLIWLLPIVGPLLVNSLMKFKPTEGSHKNKIPSWKRLVKYKEYYY